VTTNNAAFSSWEESFANYLAYGGLAGYTGGFPGMVCNPNSPNSTIHLCKTNPRSALLYPSGYFSVVGSRNATYEPTAAEWDNYAPVTIPRLSADADGWEVVDTGGGTWVLRNKTLRTYPGPGGTSTGCTLPYAVVCFQGLFGVFPSVQTVHYPILVAELDAAIVVPNGGGAGPDLTAQSLVFEVR
jgi:hypothetical protein